MRLDGTHITAFPNRFERSFFTAPALAAGTPSPRRVFVRSRSHQPYGGSGELLPRKNIKLFPSSGQLKYVI